jgi:hypothetical protein
VNSRFPQDEIEPIAKGTLGGDSLQRVRGSVGQACGTIIWEAKHTKHWSCTWLPKFRDDQRAAKADVRYL